MKFCVSAVTKLVLIPMEPDSVGNNGDNEEEDDG